MAYIYQVSLEIRPDQMSELEVGASLERVLGYLRALLPASPGHITTRAMYSVDSSERIHLIVQSLWELWEDLETHRESSLAEDKVLAEFQPHLSLEDLAVHIYREVD